MFVIGVFISHSLVFIHFLVAIWILISSPLMIVKDDLVGCDDGLGSTMAMVAVIEVEILIKKMMLFLVNIFILKLVLCVIRFICIT